MRKHADQAAAGLELFVKGLWDDFGRTVENDDVVRSRCCVALARLARRYGDVVLATSAERRAAGSRNLVVGANRDDLVCEVARDRGGIACGTAGHQNAIRQAHFGGL